MSRLHYRSIFISDVHLGLRDCQAAYLLDFLRTTQCEHLYLVGDIVDFENIELTPYWHPSHSAVLAELLSIATRGTRVTYIPGNHDAALRLRYRPISLQIKLAIPAAAKFIRGFETRVGESARAHGYDGHICGHIHR